MPKVNKMIDAFVNAASIPVSKSIGISDAIESVAKFATNPVKPFNTYDTEVTHCPAAQQWAVCTP